MSEIILTTKQDLVKAIKSVLVEHDNEKALQGPEKLYTINQVAKMLGKAHATIKKFVDAGIIRSTSNGLIPENAVNEFLGQ